MTRYIGCPTRYRTRRFFNNFTTNEDIATKLQHTLQTHSFSFPTQRTYSCSNILSYYYLFIIIIKEIPGLVASGTPYISRYVWTLIKPQGKRIDGRRKSRCEQGRIKLFGAPRQWKHFRPLFQAVFLPRGGGITPPWIKHHASQSQDRNNKYFILYIEFCINNKI